MRIWVLLALLLLACADDNRSLAPLLNRCTQDFECTRGVPCDTELGICVQRSPSLPYDYRIEVTPTAVTDAGVMSASRTERATLTDAGKLAPIMLPRAVLVSGSVRSFEDAPIEAELVFSPRDEALAEPRSIFTQVKGDEGPAFAALLEPNRLYDVQVYPRGPSSLRFPPYAFELPTEGVDLAVPPDRFRYPQLRDFSGEMRDENDLPAPRGARIKTRYRDRLLASSSIGEIGDAGTFAVQLPQAVLDAPSDHELALDIGEVYTPQNVQIAFDLDKAPVKGPWIMPALPKPWPLVGNVEVADAVDEQIGAQLTFISDFSFTPSTNDQGDVDWCQLRRPGMPKDTFRCRAAVTDYVDAARQFRVLLLPGSYRIVVTPLSAKPPVQRLALGTGTEAVQSKKVEGDFNGPRTLSLTPATLFDIKVSSPTRRPMPSVQVSAYALGLRDDLPEVATFNRTDRVSTDYDGTAEVAVDLGVYDLVAAPPEGSGFAWKLEHNRLIEKPDAGAGAIDRRPYSLTPEHPVILRGSALNASGEKVVAADVDAYALVPDLEGGPDRAVRIAHTTTDREGEFALLMPPSVGKNDNGDAGVADASADAQR